MNSTITLNYKNETYVLEYDKTSVKALENLGVDITHLLSKPVSNIDYMFQCAFLKNHPKTSLAVIDEILKSCPNKNELIAALIAMINEVCEIITGEPSEEDSKNVSWAANFVKKPSVENSTSEKKSE